MTSILQFSDSRRTVKRSAVYSASRFLHFVIDLGSTICEYRHCEFS
ncbi:hypothetical protein NIES2104_64280 [Leptolyngbya sp. NIES-2104]|nr:hypothetical protein NIES2104_64280 [Leptolyngbya sp. NIES-2104]